MHGVSVKSIRRAGINIPVLAATVIDSGDMLELVGMKSEVNKAATTFRISRSPNQSDRFDFRGYRYFLRGNFRFARDSFRRCPDQPEYEWRRFDSRTRLWMASFQASDLRAYSGAFRLDIK